MEKKRPLRSHRQLEALESLTPAVFHIMLALARGPRHGYAIMPEIEKLTHGKVRLGPGTLYRSIQRMLVDELIEELDYPCDVTSDDERRRYYRLTRLGKQVAQREAGRLAVLVQEAVERGFLRQAAGKITRSQRRRIDGS